MSLGRTVAVGLTGIVGFRVDVEVDVSSGLPAFTIGGCPDSACGQAPGRVKAAAANSGHAIPLRRVTVNLSPAAIPKIGSGFDLAIAVAALVACDEIQPALVRDVAHIGELGLDGSVRAVPGVLPLVLAAVHRGPGTSSCPSPTPRRRASSRVRGSIRSPTSASSCGATACSRSG